MTALPRDQSVLRQISPNAAEGSEDSLYPLSPDKTIVIGREASCDRVLDSNDYLEVSRQQLMNIFMVTQTKKPGNSCETGFGEVHQGL